jgi:DNA ligase-1
MLAMSVKDEDIDKLKYPLLGSIKLDGIRCLLHPEMGPVSRTLKPIPNKYIRNYLEEFIKKCSGFFDGEIVIGDLTSPDFEFGNTASGVMSEEGDPDFTFWVFDNADLQKLNYLQRFKDMSWSQLDQGRVKRLKQIEIRNKEELFEFEQEIIEAGHEGIILRSPTGKYKMGRSTLKEQYLLKRKPIEDDEAVVVGFMEQMKNTNAATKDERGHTKRSSHKDNMVPKDTLGSLILKSEKFGEFEVGGGKGMNDELRKKIWESRPSYLGKTVTFTYQKIGMKDKPRIPQFKSFREGF